MRCLSWLTRRGGTLSTKSDLQRAKEWYQNNKSKKRAYDLIYNAKNRKKKNQQSLDWVKANTQKRSEIQKASYQKHKARAFANAAARRARIMKACPTWLSTEQKAEIVQIYRNRPLGCHVDHIVPLKGENVCGLHVPWNLQYLEASENFRKKNRYG